MHKIILSGLLALSLLTLLSACNRLQSGERTTRFDETFRLYSKHLRWGHFTEVSGFMTPGHIEESLASIPSLKNVRVTHVTPISWILDEEQETMRGNVTIDYYLTNRGVIKQTSQHQVWIWQAESWKLDSGLPELR